MSTRALQAMLLALLVPGAGHFYLGKRGRAAAFFCIVIFMFTVGVSIDGSLYVLRESRGQMLTQLASLGSMGSGLVYWIGKVLAPQGSITNPAFEYGRTFALTAGLMNLLLVLDCFDIARGRKA